MPLIRCTAKLRKELGVKEAALFQGGPPHSLLGPWHANLIHINRRKCVLFVNDRTLFNFLAPDVNRSIIRDLGQLFRDYLWPVLLEEAVDPNLIEQLAEEGQPVLIAKSSDRSVLG